MSAFVPFLPFSPTEIEIRRYGYSFFASLSIHCLLLAVVFIALPPILKMQVSTLDVVLVNARSNEASDDAKAFAQTNLNGGGESKTTERAQTFLPAMEQDKEGDDLIATRKRTVTPQVKNALQRLTATHSPTQAASVKAQPSRDLANVAPAEPGLQDEERNLAISKLQAEIAQSIKAYNERPRRTFVGSNVKEYALAEYVEKWRQRVEKVGNLHYPEQARGRMYGSLVLTVAIRKNGTLESVSVSNPSPYPLLDEAALEIVRQSAPFLSLPDNANTDILEITRTWIFTSGDQLKTQ